MLKYIDNLSIRTKIPLGFGIIVFAVMALGALSVQRLSIVNDTAAKIRDDYLPSIALDAKLIGALETVRISETEYILASNDQAAASAKVQKAIADTTATRTSVQAYIDHGDEEVVFKNWDKSWAAYQDALKKLSDLIAKADDKGTITVFNGASHDAYEEALAYVKKDIDYNSSVGKKMADSGAALYSETRIEIVCAVVLAIAIGVSLAGLFIRGISSPIVRMTDAMKRLANHDLDTEVVGRDRSDEIGAMAEAVQIFKSSMIETDRLNVLQEAERKAREKRANVLEQLTTTFGNQVGALVQALSASATDMQTTATSMSTTAEQTNHQSIAVASAAEQASANVQTVAVATEELTSSISEISRQVLESAKIAGGAVEDARRTDATVQELAEGAQRIGEVVTLIKDIASQTNLLALNATIEAARAGDAGKGFSVVASEVKSLAAQTARATDEIAGQIEGIQRSTSEAVQAIRAIGRTIAEISQIATTIASAVEEQGAATQEIARNVQEAAQGTQVVTTHIASVKQAAGDTGESANHVLNAASELSNRANQLSLEVSHFVEGVKAA